MAVAGIDMDREGCKVWSANVGNTRVVLCESKDKCEQLSVDHGASNEDELVRLVDLGLDRAKILKDGRLGGYENFRCLGDYALKEGFPDVDDMRLVVNVVHILQVITCFAIRCVYTTCCNDREP